MEERVRWPVTCAGVTWNSGKQTVVGMKIFNSDNSSGGGGGGRTETGETTTTTTTSQQRESEVFLFRVRLVRPVCRSVVRDEEASRGGVVSEMQRRTLSTQRVI